MVDSVSLEAGVALASTTALGDDSDASIAGLKSWSVSVDGHFDATKDALIFAMFDGATIAVSFVLGGITYSGTGFMESYSISNPVGDKVAWSGSVTGTGNLARA